MASITYTKGKYGYVRVAVRNATGGWTTISIDPSEYKELAKFAKGSLAPKQKVDSRVTEACRAVAEKLAKKRFNGQWSSGVRVGALNMLRGAYQPAKAAS